MKKSTPWLHSTHSSLDMCLFLNWFYSFLLHTSEILIMENDLKFGGDKDGETGLFFSGIALAVSNKSELMKHDCMTTDTVQCSAGKPASWHSHWSNFGIWHLPNIFLQTNYTLNILTSFPYKSRPSPAAQNFFKKCSKNRAKYLRCPFGSLSRPWVLIVTALLQYQVSV